MSTSDGSGWVCWYGKVTLGGETSQTLDRGIRVLEVLANAGPSGMSVSQLAKALAPVREIHDPEHREDRVEGPVMHLKCMAVHDLGGAVRVGAESVR